MKKLLLSILLVSALCGLTLLTACSETIVPGSAWADVETLTYNAYAIAGTDRENPLFTLTTVMENLTPGTHTLSKNEDKSFSLGESGRRYTVRAVDSNGNELLYSESLMDTFTSVASYRKVNYGGQNYEYSSVYDGEKYVNYKLIENENISEDRIKVGGNGYVDNELLYPYLRCFSSIESNYSSAITVVDIRAKQILKLNAHTETTGEIKLGDYTAEPDKIVKSTALTITRTTSPIGKPISVIYSLSSDEGFIFKSNKTNSKSIRIPVQIIENDVVYSLVSVSV